MPLNKASCIPLVSMVPHGGQIRHYTAWYFWSDPTLHYVIFLVRSDTTLCGISRQIRHYTTWYLWSDQTLHYVVFLVRSDTTLRGISRQIRHYTMWYLSSDQTLHYVVSLVRSDSTLRGISGQIEGLWAKKRGLQPTTESRLVRSKRNRTQARLLTSQVLALPSGQTY